MENASTSKWKGYNFIVYGRHVRSGKKKDWCFTNNLSKDSKSSGNNKRKKELLYNLQAILYVPEGLAC